MPDRRLALLAAMALPAAASPAQLTWRQAGAQPPARCGHYAFFDEARGRTTIFQGQDTAATYVNDCWQLEDHDWIQVSAATSITPPRGYGAACEDAGGGGLCFGGADAVGTIFGETLRWDPRSLQVTRLAPATSPPARWVTAMAFDSVRRRAVLFGGGDQAGDRNDTWEWDGSTWTQRFPPLSPSPRSGHVMAYDAARGRVVLHGGNAGSPLPDTWTYDGTTWTNVSPATGPGAIYNAAMAYDAFRGVTVLFGGEYGGFAVNGNAWEWNGATWTQRLSGPPARKLASLTYDKQRRRMTLIGGQDQPGNLLRDAWAWDGVNWTELLPGGRGTVVEPMQRTAPVMAYSDVTNKTVLFGGFDLFGHRFQSLTDTWESAGRLWQQRTLSISPPPAFVNAGAILRSTGDLYFFPGRDASANSYNQQWNWGGQQWSPLTLSSPPITPLAHQVVGSLQSSLYGWVLVRLVTGGTAPNLTSTLQLIQPFTGSVAAVTVPGGPGPRLGSVMVQTHSASIAGNKVWLFGGSDQNGVYQNDLWELADTGSGGTLAWTRLGPSGSQPPPRRDASLAYYVDTASRSRLFLFGGSSGNGILGDAWGFDFNFNQWFSIPASGPSPRTGAVATYDPTIGGSSGQTVLLGGSDATNVLNDIWEFDSIAWHQRATPGKPETLLGSAMAYDRSNRRSLLFGGAQTYPLCSLWGYDGAAWSPLVGRGVTPPPRGALACYDESLGAMVLYLGGDTWAFTGTGAWLHCASGPYRSQFGAMVYVASQRVCLMFGGMAGLNPTPTDTWAYDLNSNQWSQVATAGPAVGGGAAMAYDRLRDRVVLFGGGSGGLSSYSDTWEYQAATGWQLRTPVHRPQGRIGHMMAYDEARGRTVMANGAANLFGPLFNETWEWDGNDWTLRMPESVASFFSGQMAYDPDRAGSVGFDSNNVRELGARIDVAGRGNTANPEGLRYYSQPVLGQLLRLGFANPQGLGCYTIGFGPLQQPLFQVGSPPLCEPGSMYANLVSQLVLGTAEPNIAWQVPNTSLILGVTLVFQAFALQPAGCWRATDALHVRF